eukprot:6528918-Pyramimonas_sp.AAC.1
METTQESTGDHPTKRKADHQNNYGDFPTSGGDHPGTSKGDHRKSKADPGTSKADHPTSKVDLPGK